MSDRPPVTSIDHIDFRAVFSFGSILRAIGSGLRPARLGLAILTLSLLVGGGRIWDGLAGGANASLEFQQNDLVNDVPANGPFADTVEYLSLQANVMRTAVLNVDPAGFVTAVINMAWGTPLGLWLDGQFWFMLVYGCWTAMILALGGGILCRMEAVEVAQGAPPSMPEAISMVSQRWWAFAVGLLVPFILAGMLGAILLLFGLVLLNIPGVNIIGGILYGLAMLVGLGMTLLVLGGVVAWPLFLPSLAVENCDATDAMNRAFAYVIGRPLRWILYVITGMIGLAMGLLLISTIMYFTVDITAGVTSIWTFNDAHAAASDMLAYNAVGDVSWWSSITGWCIAFWSSLAQWVVAGWALAYVMAASTRAYLLLRQAVDEQDPHEIWWPGLIRGTLAPEPPDHSESV